MPVHNFYSFYDDPEEKEEVRNEMDNLDVNVKIRQYSKTNDSTGFDLDFDNPVTIHSVWGYDHLVEIEHDGHKFIVSGSELIKATNICTNNS